MRPGAVAFRAYFAAVRLGDLPISCRRWVGSAVAAVALLAAPAHAQNDASTGAPAADPVDASAEDHPLFLNAAPRILQGAKRAQEREPLPPHDADAGVFQTGDWRSWPRLWRLGDWLVSGSLTGTVGLFRMGNNAFAPPPPLNPSGIPVAPTWGEFFLEPGVTVQYTPDPGIKAYGGVTYMETATRGTDYSALGNTWHGDAELLYGGLQWQDPTRALAVDASYGQQDYTVGSSLLIASGASNGAQRGANYLGPRSAWANAALLKASWHDFLLQGFWLKPNDATSAATGTRLAGMNAEWGVTGPVHLGFLYVRVPESDIVTRAGLDVYDVRARLKTAGAPGGWSLKGEYAAERKSGVAASGWYVEGAYDAATTAWQPLLSLRYASFSGDRPGTAAWEGFDPLYFGGSNPDWYQGKLGSTLVNNTNLDSVAASLTLTPDVRQIIQFVFLYFAAAQVNSPLDIPAAGMPVAVGGGVPARALANEFDASYTYTFNKYVNLNLFAGYAVPGAGYKQLYSASGGAAQNWWMIGTQFNISY